MHGVRSPWELPVPASERTVWKPILSFLDPWAPMRCGRFAAASCQHGQSLVDWQFEPWHGRNKSRIYQPLQKVLKSRTSTSMHGAWDRLFDLVPTLVLPFYSFAICPLFLLSRKGCRTIGQMSGAPARTSHSPPCHRPEPPTEEHIFKDIFEILKSKNYGKSMNSKKSTFFKNCKNSKKSTNNF